MWTIGVKIKRESLARELREVCVESLLYKVSYITYKHQNTQKKNRLQNNTREEATENQQLG